MSVPALRFKDDDGKEFPEWGESTIGERVTEKSAKFNPEKSSDTFKCIELEHLSQNTGELLGYTDTSLSKSIKNKFVTGDVLFGKLRPYLKKFLKAPFAGVCSTEIWVLKGKNISNDYLFQFVQTEYFITQTNISSGSKMPRADWNVVSSAPSYFPSLPEQTKIANFLTAVDEKISILNQKAKLLSQYKKGVMQQIFSQELRFKDDDGQEFPEWEEKTLGEVGENIIGLTYSPKNVTDDKSCPIVLRSSNIKNDMLDLNDQVRVKENIPEKLFTKKDDILICTRNGSQRLIGKNVLISNVETQMTFGAFMSVYRSPFNRFIVHLFKTDNYNEQIQMNLGARINSITTKNLNAFSFWFPSLPEQTKIANFLTAIDDKITTNQTQLNAVKQYKQGLLQQMFV